MREPCIMLVCTNCKDETKTTAYSYEQVGISIMNKEAERFYASHKKNQRSYGPECQKFHLILTIGYVKNKSKAGDD